MRISTSTIYDLGVASIQQQTSSLVKLQQQVSTGRRILTPSDDPVAAARVLEVSQSASLNKQFDTNTGSAAGALGLQESILSNALGVIQDARTVIISGGNATYDNNNRLALAAQLKGDYQQLLGMANSTDGNGQYLFSGYRSNIPPFSETTPGTVVYNGDQGQRLIQISPSRQVPVSDSGSDVFEGGKTGNGVFAATAPASNTGTGIISSGSVSGASYDGNRYQISFTSGTTYDIHQLDAAGAVIATPVSGAPYTSGAFISVGGGGQVSITGTPAAGDVFNIDPSQRQSIFKTLNDLITTLSTPVNNAADSARLSNDLNSALNNLDHAMDNILTVQSSIGARMNEIDSVKNTGQDIALQYQQTISGLQDLDYAKAISDLTQRQVGLEAAQKSFLKVQSLSLFNFIS